MKAIALMISVACMSFSYASTADTITITVVYNNVPYDNNLETSWGLSVLIEGLSDTILFDTGGDGSILLSNLAKLEIPAQSIETIVLSHIHMDHIGGLKELLKQHNEVTVYVPSSFPDEVISSTEEAAHFVNVVDTAQKVCDCVWTTGELGESIKEQSLVITTEQGLIVITGCAHPGIVNIVRFCKEHMHKDIYLVMGGFHLMAYQDSQVNEMINELRQLEVRKIAPSHCTGGRPIELFHKAWQDDFIDLGCGAQIRIPLNYE
jgi:7,8-dihydropterin-6-yl-methyl-4-(beta-D-ribofuranosyl)aminobenzene 5'-phosphate synthase